MKHSSPILESLRNRPWVETHEELRAAMPALERTSERVRLKRHPAEWVRKQLGWRMQRNWQRDFIEYESWPEEIRIRLKSLPLGFITDFSVQPDTAFLLYEVARQMGGGSIIECGCGASTVVISLAVGEGRGSFASLEENERWLASTRQALERSGRSERVRLVHAPLTALEWGALKMQAHSDAGLEEFQADLLLVDAPPGNVGRGGILPRMARHLRPGAIVLLDDAARPGERECVKLWVESGLASLQGFLVQGTGLAVLRKE